MNITKHILLWSLMAAATLPALAQSNGSNSSYSRFGLGILNDHSQGFNRSMAGVAQGLADGQIVNMQNPASYSRIDSITFIFDVGMGMQFGRFSQNGNNINARNTSFDYATMGFRLARKLGMAVGFVPYSTIGYNFASTARVGNDLSGQDITTTTSYYGNGGLHQMFLGLGWNPFAHLSIGVNAGYIWGSYNHSLSQTYAEGGNASSDYISQNLAWDSDIRTYKLDFGAQYPIILNPQNMLTLGASVGLGHKIGSEVTMMRYTSARDTVQDTRSKAFELPLTFSVGAAWQHKGRLMLAADYQQQRWEGCRIPVASTINNIPQIDVHTDQYLIRHQVKVGAEYRKDPTGTDKRYANKIKYRIGAQYTTPYTRVNGVDGPTEYGVTAGVALPITQSGRSVVNVGMEWMHRKPSVSTQITENYLMLHLGVTFSEYWFMKRKFR